MNLERNLVESCVKATDREIFSSHIVEVALRTTALTLVIMTSHISRILVNFSKFYDYFNLRNNVKEQLLPAVSMCGIWQIC